MTNAELMKGIHTQWGPLLAKAGVASSVPSAFLAALIANESGGNPSATRFEPNVYDRLRKVKPGMSDEWYRANSTSWGLLQIMGENYAGPPAELADPLTNITQAERMLADFAERFDLDLTKDFKEMFRVWNTGSPVGKCYSPDY